MLSYIKYLKTLNLPRYLVFHFTLLGTSLQTFFSEKARCKRVSTNKWYLHVKHCFHILWLLALAVKQTELTETPIKIHPQVISPSYDPNHHLEKRVKLRVAPAYISMDEKGNWIRTRRYDTANVTQQGSERNTNYSTTTKYFFKPSYR